MRKRSIVILAIVWMAVLVAGVSSAITMALCGIFETPDAQSSQSAAEVTLDEFQMIERYGRLEEVLQVLRKDYYTELKEEDLVLGAVRGMLSAVGDPYTFYYTPEEMRSLTIQSHGLYEGVGLLLSNDKKGNIVVLRVFKDSPAYEAGMLPGDLITEINGAPVRAHNSKELDQVISWLRTMEEKQIQLTVHRQEEILTIGVTRSTVEIKRVAYEILEDNVGYIAIYEFQGDDVAGFQEATKALKAAGVEQVILDLRSNPGGFLTDVVQIADALMPEGQIVYTLDRYGRRSDYFSDAEMWDVQLAVLVNGMSASASEILAGALKDTGRAVIVGETTYGKGIVQTLIPFRADGAGMQLTTATYFSPSGRSIHGVGVAPDIEVKMDDAEAPLYIGTDLQKDSQIRAAMEALAKIKK